MIITTELAQPIVDQMMGVIDYNINIMNQEGVIVASGNRDRIHQIHQGALESIELERERIIHSSDYQDMIGTQSGVNVPVELNGKVIGAVGITGEPSKIYKFIHIIKITVEALLQQLVLSEQLRYKQTALEEWIQNLIDSNFNDIPKLESQADYLKIDIRKRCSIFVIEMKNLHGEMGDYEKLHENEARIFQYLNLIYPKSLFTANIGKGNIIMGIQAEKRDSIAESLSVATEIYNKLREANWLSYIGVGYENKGVIGYRASYNEAKQSINILSRVNPTEGVAHIKKWGPLQLLSEVPPETRYSYYTRFVENTKPLSEELNETLTIYLESNRNIKQTSKILHIHRNTLLYRLDKIKEDSGLDPRNFHDAVNLQILFWCKVLK